MKITVTSKSLLVKFDHKPQDECDDGEVEPRFKCYQGAVEGVVDVVSKYAESSERE